MEGETQEADRVRRRGRPSALAWAACAGVGLLLLLPALFFSVGPLIYTKGRAWGYDPVRELFIVSVGLFVLVVLAPLVVAYRQWRGRR